MRKLRRIFTIFHAIFCSSRVVKKNPLQCRLVVESASFHSVNNFKLRLDGTKMKSPAGYKIHNETIYCASGVWYHFANWS